jgi:hypothetical protein
MADAPAIEKIASIGSEALEQTAAAAAALTRLGERGAELARLLALKNGFFAFVSGLHVFPSSAPSLTIDLARMNGTEVVWRSDYWHHCDGLFFFAADAFGGLFAIRDAAVVRFDPETGTDEPMAATLEAWAATILADHEVEVGWPLAQVWQEQNGPLAEGSRLVPVIPFVLGGAFAVENLRSEHLIQSLRMRADIARQLRDLPDGTRVQLRITD